MHMIRTLALVLALSAAACGNSSPGGGNGGSGGTGGGGGSGMGGGGGTGGGPADLAIGPDLANGFVCGSATCGPSQKCCVLNSQPTCSSSCPDGGFEAQCKGPDNCGGNPCCITIGSGFTPQGVICTTSPSACVPSVSLQTQSGMDRACHVDADCTSGVPTNPPPQLPDCCTNTMTMQHVCFNKSYLSVPAIKNSWSCP